MERSKAEEDSNLKIVQLEGQLEEMKIEMDAQTTQITESQQSAIESETKLTEMEIKMVESE